MSIRRRDARMGSEEGKERRDERTITQEEGKEAKRKKRTVLQLMVVEGL